MSLSSISSVAIGKSTAPLAVNPPASPPATTSNVSTSLTGSVGQMQQYASTLADGSAASLQDKVAAYVGISQMWGDVGGWSDQSTADQRKFVVDTFNNSSVSKKIQAASSQFNAEGMAISRADDASGKNTTISKMEYFRFTSLPPDQQQLVYGGYGNFPTLGDFVSFLKQQVDVAMQDNAQQSGQSSVTVTLSDTAKAALAASSSATDAAAGATAAPATSDPTSQAAQALKTLTSAPLTDSGADVALVVLKSAAKANAAASAQTSGDKKVSATAAAKKNSPSVASAAATTSSAYQTGETVSITA